MDESTMINLSIAKIEAEALELFRSRCYIEAANKIVKDIIESFTLTSKQKGWYWELAGNYAFLGNSVQANDYQIKAVKTTSHMLQPQQGLIYNKFVNNEEQATK
jgi:hypothetical protein